jgi:AraC-like DNA-binding protein
VDVFYHQRAPRPPLDGFVASIWLLRDGPRLHALERVLPTGAAQLIVNLKDLREQLLERSDPDEQLDAIEATLAEMLRPAGLHPAVGFALTTFHRSPIVASIGAVTDAIGMSAKRFIERFKAQVGLSPKRYCRIRRFQQAVRRAHRGQRVDWAQLALNCGYYDQSHFIHEFRACSGLTPTAYQASRTAFQNHVKFLQSGEVAI